MAITVPAAGDTGTAAWADSVANEINRVLLLGQTTVTTPASHSATTFGTSTAIAVTTINIATARTLRVRVIIPSMGCTFSTGNGIGELAIDLDNGTQWGPTFRYQGIASNTGSQGPAVEWLGSITSGSHTFGLRYWIVGSSTAATPGGPLTLFVQDIGP
jgi:hypothetical protein